MHAKSVFELPLTFQGYHALIDVCRNVGMNVQIEGLYANLIDKVVNLTLQLVGEKNA